MSILENLLFGLDNREEVSKDDVVDACKLANAHEFIETMEEKYETRIGEKGVRFINYMNFKEWRRNIR
jgi:ABC-type multidrug transport system fused ATPase/permease subunit